jgi:toprim domain protein
LEQICLIVEGRSDKAHLQRLVANNVHIICTNGTKDEEALIELIEPYDYALLFTFFDRDKSGDYLRKQMRKVYSEATQLELMPPYVGVAETPLSVLRLILKKAKIDLK